MSEYKYAVLIRSNGEIEYPDFGIGFETLRRHVKYQWFEVARRGKTGDIDGIMVDVIVLADEEGLINTPNEINELASAICSQPIVGDAWIVGTTKYDLRGFTDDELSTIRGSIVHTINSDEAWGR